MKATNLGGLCQKSGRPWREEAKRDDGLVRRSGRRSGPVGGFGRRFGSWPSAANGPRALRSGRRGDFLRHRADSDRLNRQASVRRFSTGWRCAIYPQPSANAEVAAWAAVFEPGIALIPAQSGAGAEIIQAEAIWQEGRPSEEERVETHF